MRRRWEALEGELIASFDIDGVLNYYPEPWVDYLNSKLGQNFLDLNQAKDTIPYQLYRDLKYKYRESDFKTIIPARVGAAKVIHEFKKLGYRIFILTSRPFNTHSSLQVKTLDWLYKKGVIFDRLIHGEDKYIKVLQEVPHLRFHVEDHRYYANLIARWGYRVYLVNSIYNEGFTESNVIRIDTLEELLVREDKISGDHG